MDYEFYSYDSGGADCDLSEECKIKGRGNATWTYAKKPFVIKFTKKQSPFGFPDNKSWVLLADYNDRSLLRTAYMCEISQAAGIEYTVNYKHINLFLNGEYQGIYILTDKVEAGENRIKIDRDGYLIEDDNYYADENVYFFTNLFHRYYTFKYPDQDILKEGDNCFAFIKDFMNIVESSLQNLNSEPEDMTYLDYIDIGSFSKYFVASELLGCYDPNRYYVLPSRSSKLKMMPMWDPEWSMGLMLMVWDSPFDIVSQKIWEKRYYFPSLLKSNIFRSQVKDEWLYLKRNIPQIKKKITNVIKSVSIAQAYNFEKWKNAGQVLNVSFKSWEEEVEYVNHFFDNRVIWLDEYIKSW